MSSGGYSRVQEYNMCWFQLRPSYTQCSGRGGDYSELQQWSVCVCVQFQQHCQMYLFLLSSLSLPLLLLATYCKDRQKVRQEVAREAKVNQPTLFYKNHWIISQILSIDSSNKTILLLLGFKLRVSFVWKIFKSFQLWHDLLFEMKVCTYTQ